ncbi:hypothetical protein CMV_023566 [Castanea mollissima]|uniref:C3H1-type domain-containing protein n=1 Tax=Castanea mollissima TaxID=60419 RepID=A0A8J4VDD1_9ROSI|nr:hypothetical protein CMV_023566 [Castanea mollissima]
MSKRVLCKFFAHGACLKGEHCEFSHDWKDPPHNICTYYQKGLCAYGSRCRYEHVKAARSHSSASSSSTNARQSLVSDIVPLGNSTRSVFGGLTPVPGSPMELSASSRPFIPPTKPAWNQEYGHHDSLDDWDIGEASSIRPSDRPICSFAAAGNCPRGEKCPHLHGDLCPTCGKHCLHPFRPEEREEHLKSCEKKQKHLEALKHSQEIECSVCLERVHSKPTAAERKEGSHSEKQDIVDSYKAKLKSIDCKHFDFGNGNCPFGSSCFYKHKVKPGSYTWRHHRPPPRRSGFVDDLFDMFNSIEELTASETALDPMEELTSLEMALLLRDSGY